MSKGTTFLIAGLLSAAVIIALEILMPDWSIYYKIGPAGFIMFVGLLIIAIKAGGSSTKSSGSTETPKAAPTATPEPPKPHRHGSKFHHFVTNLMIFAFVALLLSAAGWFVVDTVYPYLRDTTSHDWFQNQPEPRVVNNGFHRHDAQFPPLITPVPFSKRVQADRLYKAFEIKAGQRFRLTIDRPIELRIRGNTPTEFERYDSPGRYRAVVDGTIEFRSETGRNRVQISPTN